MRKSAKEISEVKTIKLCIPHKKCYRKTEQNEVRYQRIPLTKLHAKCKCFIKYTTDDSTYKNGYIIKNCHPKYFLLKNFQKNSIWALNLKQENLSIYEKKI